MPSANYEIFREAIRNKSQVTCVYDGHYREVCPHVIGHKEGAERVLAYQFGGTSRSGLPAGGEWRCLNLSEITDARMRKGPWHSRGVREEQQCVDEVDIDITVHVRGRR